MDFIFDKLNWLCNHRKLRAFHVVFLPLLMVLLHNYVWAVIIMAVITFVFNFFVTTQLMLDVFGRDQDIETYREALSYAHAVVAKSEALIEEKELAEEDRKLLLIGLALAKMVSDKALTDPAEAEKYLTVLREMRQSGQVPTGVP